ncbi:MAG: site-specific integrase, partial [Firmicutes bacterium]|nr:site-specific integrase [Bacillota bacterium]
SGRRYRVFFRLLLETGLRIGEAVAVGVKDVDLDARVLYVRCGKGAKDRIVPLTEGMAEDVRRYLQRLRPRPASPEDAPYLWLTRTGHRLSKSTVRVALEAVCKRAGLDPTRLHPHAWRAAFASRLARAGVPLTTIQELMGHASPVTTAHYVGVAPQAMREAVERAALAAAQDAAPGGDGR